MKKIRLLLILLFFSSCSPVSYYYQQEEGEKKLEISKRSFLKDIPVPGGFKFLPLESFIYQARNARVCVLKYYGSSWPHTLTEFYKENMPKYGWEILSTIVGKESLLTFKKNDELCTVKFILKGRKKILLSISITSFYKKVDEGKSQ